MKHRTAVHLLTLASALAAGVLVCESRAAAVAAGLAAPSAGAVATPLFLPALEASRPGGPLLIDGPWTSLPSGAGPGIVLDAASRSLTLECETLRLVHVLDPHPGKPAFANSVRVMANAGDRLYLGYGDMWNNRGPVDIVSYDPIRGDLRRELVGLPEEQVGGWSVGRGGRVYAAGQDSQEGWGFGSFYVRADGAWTKRRTLYRGVHVGEVVEYGDRLIASWSTDETAEFARPFVVVSGDGGVTWDFVEVDTDPMSFEAVASVAAVGDVAYAVLYLQLAGSEETTWRLYRTDGAAWSRVSFPQADGSFSPQGVRAFGRIALVRGTSRDAAGSATPVTFAVHGDAVREVGFLRGRTVWWEMCAPHDSWIYCVLQTEPYGNPASPYELYRTQDAVSWQRIGGYVALQPGARPISIEWSGSRLFVGAMNAGWEESSGGVALWSTPVHPIADAVLAWDADVPDGASLGFKVRSAATTAAIVDAEWVGPDGTPATAYTASGDALHPRHDADTAFQVAVHRTPNAVGEIPLVRWVSLQQPSGWATYAVDDGQGLYAASNADRQTAVYTSRPFVLANGLDGARFSADADLPEGTRIAYQFRTADTLPELDATTFVGPDGSPTSSFDGGGRLWSGHDGGAFHSYVQYRAILSSSDPVRAPRLRRVIIATRPDSVARVTIDLPAGMERWIAGATHAITVTAWTGNVAHVPFTGRIVPVHGEIALSAMSADTNEAAPIQPEAVRLAAGTGTARVTLERAGPTHICAVIDDVRECNQWSPVMVVPAAPDRIDISTDAYAVPELWSDVVHAGRPFSLTLVVVDRFGNTVTDYAGTVRCDAWRRRRGASVTAAQTFTAADRGRRALAGAATIDALGEWNIACSDVARSRVAGSLTVNVVAAPFASGASAVGDRRAPRPFAANHRGSERRVSD